MTSDQQNGRVVFEIRDGPLVATLWANPGEHGERLSASVKRSYRRTPEKPWEETKMSFPEPLILRASELLRLVYQKALEYGGRDESRRIETPDQHSKRATS